jgi:hypothetical protein
VLNLTDLIATTQTNCDISDAQYAGDYGLCTYLLKMREYYRWERNIPYFADLPKDELSAWLTEREQHWKRIETAPLAGVPVQSGAADPFDSDSVNRDLVPHGYVYSGGYGRFHKPIFFLGRLLREEERGGFTILISSSEYARELAAPPAMLQGRTIYVRQESARRFVSEKIEEWQWARRDNAMGRAVASCDTADRDVLLERLSDDAMHIMILHELGEGYVDGILGDTWASLLESLSRSPGEIVVRAIRDHIADCHSTLPALIERAEAGPLHFYFANFDGARKALFKEMQTAYRRWVEGGKLQSISAVAKRDEARWLEQLRSLLETHRNDPHRARALVTRLLPSVNPH